MKILFFVTIFHLFSILNIVKCQASLSLVDTSQIIQNTKVLLLCNYFPLPYWEVKNEGDVIKAVNFFNDVKIEYLNHNLPNYPGKIEYTLIRVSLIHQQYEILDNSNSEFIIGFLWTQRGLRIYRLAGFEQAPQGSTDFISGLYGIVYTKSISKKHAFRNAQFEVQYFDIEKAIRNWRKKRN